jgi:hypothetical protein
MDSRRLVLVAATAVVVAAAVTPIASAKGFRRNPRILRVEAPLGTQGTSGAGPNVVLPFVVADVTGKAVDVEVQFGLDFNADGVITEDEYRHATEDRLDVRNTRTNEAPQLFTTGTLEFTDGTQAPTGAVDGAAQAYVWHALSDIGTRRMARLEYLLTPQGRPVPDPENPGSFLFATGPSGVAPYPGVKARMRTFFKQRRPNGRRRTVYGEWMYSDAFVVDNTTAPSATIDWVESGSPLLVHWTAYDGDSEDFNGNGDLDVADGEDVDGDGVLHCERIGVAFDFHIVGDGEDPASMTDQQLASLTWIQCTRVPDVGDTDSLDARPGVPVPTTGVQAGVCSAPPGVGRQWVFAWDPVVDIGTTTRGFILRATPFDESRARGDTVYSRTIVYEAQ